MRAWVCRRLDSSLIKGRAAIASLCRFSIRDIFACIGTPSRLYGHSSGGRNGNAAAMKVCRRPVAGEPKFSVTQWWRTNQEPVENRRFQSDQTGDQVFIRILGFALPKSKMAAPLGQMGHELHSTSLNTSIYSHLSSHQSNGASHQHKPLRIIHKCDAAALGTVELIWYFYKLNAHYSVHALFPRPCGVAKLKCVAKFTSSSVNHIQCDQSTCK